MLDQIKLQFLLLLECLPAMKWLLLLLVDLHTEKTNLNIIKIHPKIVKSTLLNMWTKYSAKLDEISEQVQKAQEQACTTDESKYNS